MSKQHHTPGPWRAIRPTRPSDGNHWQVLAASPHVRGAAQTVCRVSGPWNAKNYAANARLIAASPDLLRELTDLSAFVASFGDHLDHTAFVRAAESYVRHARAAIIAATPTHGKPHRKDGPDEPA